MPLLLHKVSLNQQIQAGESLYALNVYLFIYLWRTTFTGIYRLKVKKSQENIK